MMNNRSMGLDIGEKTIGIAISDRLSITAQPLTTIRRKGWEEDMAALKNLIDANEVTQLVIGLPKNMDGTIGRQAEYIYKVAHRIQEALPDIALEYVDERLTTVMAEKAMLAGQVKRKKRREIIDRQAASLILQTYLERIRIKNERQRTNKE